MSTYSHDTQRALMRARIDQLYQETGMEQFPEGTSRSITPLGELIGFFNLASKELTALSPRAVLQYLSQQGGLIESTEEAGQDALAGFLYTSTSYGCFFVEASDYVVRRRFSAAHELGHYLLHFQPLLLIAERDHESLELTEALYRERTDDPEATESGRVEKNNHYALHHHLPPEAQMEYEANQFATELLMPEETVRRLFARAMLRMSDDDVVAYLASVMLVSFEAMRWRLRNFGLLPLPGRRTQRGGGQ